LALQAKVLTAVEDRQIRRLGANKPIKVDVRLVAASNQSLQGMVARGEFREDLFHRLDLYRLKIPPLRDRSNDLIPLAEKLLRAIEGRHKVAPKEISQGGRSRLLQYPWPGNVRELMHALERAVVFEEGPAYTFPTLQNNGSPSGLRGSHPIDFVFPEEGFSLEEEINRMIEAALRQTQQNVSGAARLLGVSRDYIRYRLRTEKEGEDGK
jgi:two-component system, NtrC family, response regulator AtoC